MAEETEVNEEILDASSDESQDENLETELNEVIDGEDVDETDSGAEEEDDDKPLTRKELRIQELVAERNAYQRLAEARTQQQPVHEETLPELDPEIETAVNARLSRVTQQYQQQLGQLVEKLDESQAVSLPGYAKVKAQINDFRETKAAQGIYFTREEAYNLLKGNGTIKVPVQGKKVSVVKSKPKVGIERQTAQTTKVSSKKAFNSMSLQEKEDKLGDQTF